MKVAVVGVGVAGLTSARTLASAGAQVTLNEKEDYIGGHSPTIHHAGTGLDTGFMVFNRVTYPNMIDFFEQAGVEMEESDMSFSVSLDGGRGCEWGSNSLGGFFALKCNRINPFLDFQLILLTPSSQPFLFRVCNTIHSPSRKKPKRASIRKVPVWICKYNREASNLILNR